MTNPTSERIDILIRLLNEIEKSNAKHNTVLSSNSEAENDNAVQGLMFDAVESVAVQTEKSPHSVERTLNDIITGGDMRFNIVHFCRNITDWLVTGDKTEIKKILTYNTDENFKDADIQAIEEWYSDKK